MKKIFLLLILIISFSFSKNILNLTLEEKEFIKTHPIINVGAETDWPPFDFFEKGKYSGISKEYLSLISKSTGFTFNYIHDLTWEELLSSTKNKEIDLLPILSKTEDREKYLLFTDNYITIRDYLFSFSKKFNSLSELENKTVAIPAGFVQIEYLEKFYPKIKIAVVSDVLQAIDYVVSNKADAFISNIPLVEYLLKKNNISGISAQFVLNKNSSFYMATRDDYPILKNIINKALLNISKTQKDKISNKWIRDSSIYQNELFTKKELAFLQKNKKIYVANELDWVPYDYNEDGVAKGYIIDYTKLLFSKMGVEVVFIADSWKELMRQFKEGKIDVLPVLTYNKKRESFLNFTKPYIEQELSIVTRSKRFDLINTDDLNGKTVALVKGWNSTKIIKENYPDINYLEMNSLKEVFEAVKNNLADATIQNNILSNFYIKKQYKGILKSDVKAKIKNFDSRLYMGISKNMPILRDIINKSMSEISNDELEVLNNKWLKESLITDFTKEEKEFIANTLVKVVFTDNWAPINFVQDEKPYGLGYDFWKLIANKANLKTVLDFKDTFSGALKSIELKEDDIILATSKTKDREKYAIFSDIFYQAPIGIATLQDKNYIPDASHLVGKKIGVGRNYSAHKILEKAYPNIDFVLVEDIKEGLSLLSNNKIYALVDNMPVLVHNIKKYAHSDIKISGNTGLNFKLQMMIRNDYPILQSIINKVLMQLSPEEKKVIFNKWTKIDFEQETDYLVYLKFIIPLLLIILFVLYKNRQLVKYQRSLKYTKNELENTLISFKTLVNLTIEGIIIVKDGKIVFSNNVFLKMFNLNSNVELGNKTISDLFEKKDRLSINSIIENKDSKTYEINALKTIELKFPTLVKSKEIIFDNTKSNIISIIDMSEIKDKENLLIQQSKMASLGEMIGNIAHQWRQPLSFISTASSGIKLQKEFGDISDKDMNNTLDSITETTKFLSQTIDDFQNYLKDDKTRREFDINNSINKILNITKGSIVNNYINVSSNLDEGLYIYGYENELNQALLNIVNNAKDALSEIDKNDRFLFIKTSKMNNEILIEIIDNAGGIKPEVLSKIFDPYFTTKHKSQGTGLGLYMTHKMITESMNGEIKILNVSHTFGNIEFEKCSNVVITLPVESK